MFAGGLPGTGAISRRKARAAPGVFYDAWEMPPLRNLAIPPEPGGLHPENRVITVVAVAAVGSTDDPPQSVALRRGLHLPTKSA